MNKKKIIDLPTRSQSTLSKSVSVDENGIYIQPCEIVTYRPARITQGGYISVNTGKLATIKGGYQLFRINVYNHASTPNLIILSIWTLNNGSGIGTNGYIGINPNTSNTISIYEDDNRFICFKINAANSSSIIIEDLSAVKYPITFI